MGKADNVAGERRKKTTKKGRISGRPMEKERERDDTEGYSRIVRSFGRKYVNGFQPTPSWLILFGMM